MIIVFTMNNPTEFILCPMIIIFPMHSPSTRGRLLQTKSVGSGSFVVSLQAKNQFSKPSTEMELVRWPRAARSTTCEQDRPTSKIDVCVWFCISHQKNMACSDVSMMTVICVCVILHIASWRYGRIQYVKTSNRSRSICNGPLMPVTSTHLCNGCCLAPATYKCARTTTGLASTTPVTNVDFW
jgi:hypothetical protein